MTYANCVLRGQKGDRGAVDHKVHIGQAWLGGPQGVHGPDGKPGPQGPKGPYGFRYSYSFSAVPTDVVDLPTIWK